MLKVTTKGSTKRTQKFLQNISSGRHLDGLESLAAQGVAALQAATPIDSGATAASWSYEIEKTANKTTIYWINTNNNGGVNIAVILQYGHGTGTGGYISGQDYINGALKPVFDRIANDVWRKVTSA